MPFTKSPSAKTVAKDPRNPTPSEKALKDNAASLLIALGMDQQTLADATKNITYTEETRILSPLT